jgi:hypothetical protein
MARKLDGKVALITGAVPASGGPPRSRAAATLAFPDKQPS